MAAIINNTDLIPMINCMAELYWFAAPPDRGVRRPSAGLG